VAEWGAKGRLPTGADALRLAAAELAVGRPSRAGRLLALPGVAAADSAIALALRAAVADGQGGAADAAAWYEQAARVTSDRRAAGLLLARAGVAHQQAGAAGPAASAFAHARALLPEIAGWLALREAPLRPDTAGAEGLITLAPEPARPLARAARATLRLRAGDTASAEQLLADAGHPERAGALALARGDSARARARAVEAVVSGDTAVQRAGLALLDAGPGTMPVTPEEWMAAAGAAARLGEAAHAARLAGRAVALGDSGPGALVRWGDLLERAGRRGEALVAYRRAGPAGEFPLARALLRSGQRTRAIPALRAFADSTPDDPQAPVALYLAADAAADDSLLAAVALRWPAHEYAARARQRLALARLARRDTVGALRYFDAGARAGASDEPLARFHAGRLRLAQGDSAGRMGLLALAHSDSLGYYGFQARAALGLAPPQFGPAPQRPSGPGVQAFLEELALLEAAGMSVEANLLVTHATERGWDDPEALLDASEGLTAAGRPAAGIRLAWRAATGLTLNHPRVLRAVFPWPERDLIEREAAKFDLDPFLLAGLIRQESGFAAGARSRAGAVGAMQLMPATARELARRLQVPWSDAMRAVMDANVHVGAAHLAGLFARYRGDPIPTLAAYNAGGTPVSRWLRAGGSADRLVFVEGIAYPETQGYVRTVWRNAELYRALYGPASAAADP
jgi:soluble lytic murein transglycosylase